MAEQFVAPDSTIWDSREAWEAAGSPGSDPPAATLAPPTYLGDVPWQDFVTERFSGKFGRTPTTEELNTFGYRGGQSFLERFPNEEAFTGELEAFRPFETEPPPATTPSPEVDPLSRETIRDLVTTGGLTQEEIDAQKELITSREGIARLESLEQIKSQFAGRGTGAIRTELISELRRTDVAFNESTTQKLLDVDFRNKQFQINTKLSALALNLNADQIGIEIWKELNNQEQLQFENDFRERALELGHAKELAALDAEAEASGITIGELLTGSIGGYMLTIGSTVNPLVGVGLGLLASIFGGTQI